MAEWQSLKKAERLSRLTHLLHRHPRGLTTGELARSSGVSRRTIQREIDNRLSGLLLAGTIQPGHRVVVGVRDGTFTFEQVDGERSSSEEVDAERAQR